MKKTSKLEIKPRRMRFDFSDTPGKYWYRNNPLISTFFVAMSATFPEGERHFVRSVRRYLDQISDPELIKQVRGFIGQEAHHGRVHEEFNQNLDTMGLDASYLEQRFKRYMEQTEPEYSDAENLAITVGMEHFTAIMADYVLNHPEVLEGVNDSFKHLITWHAIEEIEHKAVAYDVYAQCVGDDDLRRRFMLVMSVIYLGRLSWYQFLLLYRNKTLPTPGQLIEAARFFYGKDGLFRKTGPAWLSYFKEDFHPWEHDNSALVENWKAIYPDLADLEAA